MKRELTPAEKSAIRTCIQHYIEMVRKLRAGVDVTEDLKDEFERSRFNPVCLLSAEEDRQAHPTHFCRVCALADGHIRGEDPRPDMEAFNDYQVAGERCLEGEPSKAECDALQVSLLQVIRAHWQILRANRLNNARA